MIDARQNAVISSLDLNDLSGCLMARRANMRIVSKIIYYLSRDLQARCQSLVPFPGRRVTVNCLWMPQYPSYHISTWHCHQSKCAPTPLSHAATVHRSVVPVPLCFSSLLETRSDEATLILGYFLLLLRRFRRRRRRGRCGGRENVQTSWQTERLHWVSITFCLQGAASQAI